MIRSSTTESHSAQMCTIKLITTTTTTKTAEADQLKDTVTVIIIFEEMDITNLFFFASNNLNVM